MPLLVLNALARNVEILALAFNANEVQAKIIGNNFRYTEETRWNKSTKIAAFKGIPSTQADKLKTEGSMRVEALPGNRCKRVVDFTTEAKIMLVGGMLEDTAEDNMRKSYNKNAVFMQKWLADKGLKNT